MLPTLVPFIEALLLADRFPPPQSIPFFMYEFVLRSEDIDTPTFSEAPVLEELIGSATGPRLSGRPWLPDKLGEGPPLPNLPPAELLPTQYPESLCESCDPPPSDDPQPTPANNDPWTVGKPWLDKLFGTAKGTLMLGGCWKVSLPELNELD